MSVNTISAVRSLVVATVVSLCATAPAFAQRTLNHSTALNGLGGCDEPGYPLTICNPGSYRLASDLRVPAGSDGVVIQVSLVTLDLNGFSIYQTGTCGSGNGNGIRSAPALTAVTVANGTVSCHGANGVSLLGGRHRVERVTAIGNKGRGIVVGEESLVSDSNATQNGATGIFALTGCRISGSSANANGLDGIDADAGSLVFGNTARANAGYGLFLNGAAYGHNVLSQNAVQVSGGHSMGHNICIGGAPCQ
jgi:hypothetical protein